MNSTCREGVRVIWEEYKRKRKEVKRKVQELEKRANES